MTRDISKHCLPRKAISIISIVAVLVMLFAIQSSALEISYTTDTTNDNVQTPVPFTVVANLNTISANGRLTTDELSFPSTLNNRPIYNVREFGFVMTTENLSFGRTLVARADQTYYSSARCTFQPYTIDLTASGGNSAQILLRADHSGTNTARFEYIVYDVDDNVVADSFMSTTTATRLDAVYLTPTGVKNILSERYPTAVRAVITKHEFFTFDEYEYTAIYYPSDNANVAIFSPVDYTPVVKVEEIFFDGDVGVADLLIEPLQAIINFELFPNFSLGAVFAILASIALVVAVLKMFAGG